jgi:hypothetical protein
MQVSGSLATALPQLHTAQGQRADRDTQIPTPPTEPDTQSADTSTQARRELQLQAQQRVKEAQQQRQIDLDIRELAARDREVRTHEQAHVAAGGQYAGAPVYQFERGPNGVNYAVSGEVPISTGEEATPEATLQKARIIRRAALAPAEPSPQDRRVAAMASQMEVEARAEIARARTREEEEASTTEGEATATEAPSSDKATQSSDQPAPHQERESERLRQRFFTSDTMATPARGTLLSRMA